MSGKKLLKAVINRDLNMVKKLILEDGVDINYITYDWTPLTKAIQQESDEIAHFLLKNGADVNLASGDDWTPVYAAIQRNLPEIFIDLINHGLDINATVRIDNCPPIEVAYNKESTKIVAILLKKGITLPIDKLKNVVNIAKNKNDTETVNFLTPLIAWQKLDDSDIQHYSYKGDFKVTRIFNFQAMNILTILQDKHEKNLSHDEKHFSDPSIDIDLLHEAKKELLAKDGIIDDAKFKQAIRSPIRIQNRQMRIVKKKLSQISK